MSYERKDFPRMEEEILSFWKKNNIFQKTIDNRKDAPDYVFYDGPPFATGLPHHGHILASTSKDLIGRYKTMRGFKVLRSWGWDCHGLPIENLIEEELNISGKNEIEEHGVDKFCQACEASVLKYDKEWESTIDRIGRFVDFKNNYKTMDKDYMESVWWGFKQLWDKNLVVKDTRISLYCPRCETPLSNSEIAMDNSYKTVTDPSVYVKLKLKDDDEFLLIWTTTPWTLPANTAVAVNPEIEYVKVETNGEKLILAKDLLENLQEELGDYKILETKTGEQLLGLKYEPLFTYFKATKEKTHTVVAGDFVTTQDGTGLVHIAPTFGEDDYKLGKEQDLDFFETVDSQAKFVEEVTDFAGRNVWNINQKVLELLKERGVVFKTANVKHEYPFCYRCDTKLIYKTQPAWFVKVTEIKDRMIELNKEINWYPDHLKNGRFGKGLETAPDWNISRSRFWGNPIPIWINNETQEKFVPESIEELEKVSGMKIDDLHKPKIDDVKWEGEQGGVFERIPEVFDCWFESGSMPWASVHYPFENKEFFENNYPAEFITEYIAQTRGWFYNMHVLATAIFDKPSFTNAVTTGTILAENGQKMSKSKKNFTPPQELFDKYGVDSMRYYLMSSPLMKGENLRYSDKEQADVFRKVIMITWNVYTFFETYKDELQDKELKTSDNILDKWILSKLNLLIKNLTEKMDHYDITTSTRLIGEFIDELSTWYLRRSRDRFKNEEDKKDKEQALNTTYNVLLNLSKILAPITPFIAEDLYKHLQGEKESVHLEDWPTFSVELIDNVVLTNMETARAIIEKVLALRAENSIKVRQALNTVFITSTKLPEEYYKILMEELNVKEIKLVDSLEKLGDDVKFYADENVKVGLDIKITEELKKEGNLRELIRFINSYRKELNLTPKDIVEMRYESDELVKLIEEFNDELLNSNKLKSITKGLEVDVEYKEFDINGSNIKIQIIK